MLFHRRVFRASLAHLFPVAARMVVLSGALALALPAKADVPLTRADVEALLNRVEMMPRGASPRPARLSDFLGLGDALRTAAASRAELRFNDGSLARIGERATFQFVPNTRNFRLSNGTVLLLIPPGQGRTTIQTPSAVTGIQGSGVVVRYVQPTNTTAVMALTENTAGPILVTLPCTGQRYALQAGQMALIQDCDVQILSFDLKTFYETSNLVEDLYLDDPTYQDLHGDPINLVRQETLQALANQGAFEAEAVIDPRLLDTAVNPQPSEPQSRLVTLGEALIRDWNSGSNGGYSSVTMAGQILEPQRRNSNPSPTTSGATLTPPLTTSRPPSLDPPSVDRSQQPPSIPVDPGIGTPPGGESGFPDKGDLLRNNTGSSVTNPGPGSGVTNPGPGSGVTNPGPGSGVTNPGPGSGVTNPGPGSGVTNPGSGSGVTNPSPGPGLGGSTGVTNPGVGGTTGGDTGSIPGGTPGSGGNLPGVGNGATNPSTGGGVGNGASNPAAGGVVPGVGNPAGGSTSGMDTTTGGVGTGGSVTSDPSALPPTTGPDTGSSIDGQPLSNPAFPDKGTLTTGGI